MKLLPHVVFPGPNPADIYIRAIVEAAPNVPFVYCTIPQPAANARAAWKEETEGGEQKRECRKEHRANFRASIILTSILSFTCVDIFRVVVIVIVMQSTDRSARPSTRTDGRFKGVVEIEAFFEDWAAS